MLDRNSHKERSGWVGQAKWEGSGGDWMVVERTGIGVGFVLGDVRVAWTYGTQVGGWLAPSISKWWGSWWQVSEPLTLIACPIRGPKGRHTKVGAKHILGFQHSFEGDAVCYICPQSTTMSTGSKNCNNLPGSIPPPPPPLHIDWCVEGICLWVVDRSLGCSFSGPDDLILTPSWSGRSQVQSPSTHEVWWVKVDRNFDNLLDPSLSTLWPWLSWCY